MKRWLIHLGALALALPPLSARPAAVDWLADFDRAVEVAKREKKDLFVDFTGSDWCGFCIRLDREVFAHRQFLEAAKRDFVLVKLDFPKSEAAKAKVPNPVRNRELQARYGVGGFPTVLLMTAEGQVYGRTGYREGGAEMYVEHLQEIRTASRKELARIQAQIDAFLAAEGEERVAAARGLLENLRGKGANSPFASLIGDALKGFLEEHEDQDLQREIVRALVGAGQVDAKLVARARALDPKNAEGFYHEVVVGLLQAVSSEEQIPAAVQAIEDLLATGGVKEEHELNLRFAAADWSHRFLDKPEAAKVHARRALELAPRDNERLIDFLRNILDA